MELESLKNMTLVLGIQASFLSHVITQHYSFAIACYAGFGWLLLRMKNVSIIKST